MLPMYFTITLSYWALDDTSTSGRMKKCQNTIACSAENYTDAEATATKWGSINIEEEFHISPIKELNISFVQQKDNKKGLWFLCSGVWLEVDDIRNKVKENKIQYLIQADDSTEASLIMNELLKNDFLEETRVVDVKETKIEEYV